MKFRLKKKPGKKPVRKYIKTCETLSYSITGEQLLEIISKLEKQGVSPSEMSLGIEYGYYDEQNLVLIYMRPEDEKNYQKRVESWQKRVDEYEAWYKDNREQIEAELTSKEVAAKAKAEKNYKNK